MLSGRSLYDEYRSLTSSVNISSCVGASMKSAPRRSLTRNTPSPYSVHRPVISYGSRGSSAGKCTSWNPAASISSRTMRSTLRNTIHPSGRNVKPPGAARRM